MSKARSRLESLARSFLVIGAFAAEIKSSDLAISPDLEGVCFTVTDSKGSLLERAQIAFPTRKAQLSLSVRVQGHRAT